MSGTSLDGVDGALVEFPIDFSSGHLETLASAYIAFPADLRSQLLALQASCDNEIHSEALAAHSLAQLYEQCVKQLLAKCALHGDAICAIGAHGQTIRHKPELGYTRQLNNPALLAELTGIDVVADFRSRDIAAGGHGAPLVPAFHKATFGKADETRVVVNIGGISNISVLHADGNVIGFDTGPGNVLMDIWIGQHLGRTYDSDGTWASSGTVVPALLDALRSDPFFTKAPPKSTGRDLFHLAWLNTKLAPFSSIAPVDVQATLAALTATTIADAIQSYAAGASATYVCGGGAHNTYLMQLLKQALQQHGLSCSLQSTDTLGVAPNHVEALAFAWLAHRFTQGKSGNLAEVTGAKGPRILGALYPGY